MSQVDMLLYAVSALAGLFTTMFVWARVQFDKCQKREAECQLKYEQILKHLAGIKS